MTDLLTLQRCVSRDRSRALPPPLVEPLRVKWFAESGQLKPERKADLRKAVEEPRTIANRYAGGICGDAELAKAARWVADDGKLLGLEAAK